MRRCSSCDAYIIWTISTAGKKTPVDMFPSWEGTILLVDVLPETLAIVLSGPALELANKQLRLRTSHFATCPHADRHRMPRDGAQRLIYDAAQAQMEIE